ncbi:hypothetical protein TIFTF001_036397 [Ficus carica]|uniref:Uncharacterized protein n=1 Tax=Ficus carica TaxID=3494 RepID=A0AA88EDJ7_FICCA|nr:hypothetical protein TIFTF001_036397 [Ficus carica]
MIIRIQHTVEPWKEDADKVRSDRVCYPLCKGISRTLRAKSLNPGVDVVALCSCEEKRCSICAFNVLISSDIMFRIMTSTFIVLGGTGPSGAYGNLSVDRRVGVVILLGSGHLTGCVCVRRSAVTGVFPGVDRGCIGATGLFVVETKSNSNTEQAAGSAVVEEIPEVEEVATGAITDSKNEVDEVTAGAVADAANEVEEVTAGAVTDVTNEVEEVVAGGVTEVVANDHIDVEEKEIDLNNILIHIEAQHTAKFDFMANRYTQSFVAANADSVVAEEVSEVVAAKEDITEPVIILAQAIVANEVEEVVAAEEINPIHVPADVVAGEAKDLNSSRKNDLAVPAVVQVEITGAMDEAEQAAGGAVVEEIPKVEEVATGAVTDAENEVDEVTAGAVADAANEFEEVTASGVTEVVANSHVDVEEEEIDLNNILIHIEAQHTAMFDFMANRYARSPVAANADSVVAEEVSEVVAEVAGGREGRRR